MRVRRPALRHSITRRRTGERRRGRDVGRRGERGHGGTPWLTLAATLPGLAALVALMFNWVSVSQTRTELRIAEQAQFTTRFNVAVTHLGSSSADVRFGGIYALERIMQDSPRDQPRIIAVLSAYVRTHAPVPAGGLPRLKEEEEPPLIDPDVTAVTEVLSERLPGHDGRTKINWQNADLRGLALSTRHGDKDTIPFGGDPSAPRRLPFALADLSGADLQKATFDGVDLHSAGVVEANLAGASLADVKLSDASLVEADLTQAGLGEGTSMRGAILVGATLVEAELSGVDLTEAWLLDADLTDARLTGGFHRDSGSPVPTNLTNADLTGANLTRADLGLDEDLGLPAANLTGADLSGANLADADLTAANLTGADLGPNEEFDGLATNLTGADLSGANLQGANLARANLKGANLTGANLNDANLTGANLSGAKLEGASTDKTVGLPPSPVPL